MFYKKITKKQRKQQEKKQKIIKSLESGHWLKNVATSCQSRNIDDQSRDIDEECLENYFRVATLGLNVATSF